MKLQSRAARGALLPVLVLALGLVAQPAMAAAPPTDNAAPLPTLAPLMEKVTPAVVNIAVMQPAPEQNNPLLRDPFFRRFFDLPEAPPARPQMSAGSGVIVDAEKGYVLTNHHVVADAEKVVVTLKDRRQIEAKMIGSDKGTDVALLQIEADGLTALPLGNSDELRVGDYVVAIGNPFALGQTVTSGIVSAVGRSGLNVEGYESFIQTDAAINPGNSGGALVNLRGELVGINTAIIGPGGNIGIGFAVPSNMARAIMDQLVRYGEVKRGRIGVAIQDVTPDVADAMGLRHRRGALVARVESGSPADQAGIKPGDVIIGINGRPVRGASDLRATVGVMPVGQSVTVEVVRDGKAQAIELKVGEAGEEATVGNVEELPPALAGAKFAPAKRSVPQVGPVEGMEVTGVAQGSPAWRNGLRQGDLVLAINRQRVTDAKGFADALENAHRVLALDMVRDGERMFVVIR